MFRKVILFNIFLRFLCDLKEYFSSNLINEYFELKDVLAKFCGLYYKHVTIVINDSSVISKWSFKLIDDPRVIIYDRHRFIIQATGLLDNPQNVIARI